MDEHLKQWLREQLPRLMTEAMDGQPAAVSRASSGEAGASLTAGTPGPAPASAAQITPLLVEASQRHFYRVQSADRSLVLMQSPPQLERNDAFVALSQVLGEARIPVPKLYAADFEQGYFLMQDLGVQALREHYGTGEESAAVGAAIELLPRLQAVRSAQVPPYSRERLADELEIFSDWFLGALLNGQPPDFLGETFRQLVAEATAQPQVCVHRDYHCRNLLWNEGALGVVDFQDALHGPYTYDLASLLHDCYYHWPAAALARYREQGRRLIAPETEPEVFKRQLEWMAVQRQLKAIGIFVRLKLRDGRSSHLPHVLPTLEQCIRLTAGYGELEPLSRWLESLLPDARRQLAQLSTP